MPPNPMRRLIRLLLLLCTLPFLAAHASDGAPASGSEWVLQPGETPASLARVLFPGQPAVQRRFVLALAEANPAAGIDGSGNSSLAPGATLRMPDWQAFASTVPAEAARRPGPRAEIQIAKLVDGVAGEPPLWLSTTLGPAPAIDETLRQTLRLEYRLLQTLSEQLSQLNALADSVLPSVATAGPLPQAIEPPSAQPAVPVRLNQGLPPVSEVPEEAPFDLTLPLLGAALLLVLAVVLLRRRKQVPVPAAMPIEPSHTIIVDTHPEFDRGPVAPQPVPARMGETPVAAGALPAARVPVPAVAGGPAPVFELAEVMMSFGRFESAAQTLLEYIDANPSDALAPSLRLLEVYRHGRMRQEFEAFAQRLHESYNIELQQWDAEAPPPAATDSASRPAALEDLPDVCKQLLAVWNRREECLDFLRRLLREKRDGERGGFALPVIEEILMLIEIQIGREATA